MIYNPPMPAETLKLLKQSIAHWTRLATGKAVGKETIGPGYCCLCDNFRYPINQSFDDCHGCPVAQATEQPYCRNTPYNAVDNYFWAKPENSIQDPEFKRLAQIELDFLISLLPDGESPTL